MGRRFSSPDWYPLGSGVKWCMVKITGSMTKFGMVLNTRLTASRAHPGQSPVGSGSIKLVLIVMWATEGQPMTHRQISDITGMSYTQSNRCAQLLVDKGFLIAERVGRVTKRYRLNMDKLRENQLEDIPGPHDLDYEISVGGVS